MQKKFNLFNNKREFFIISSILIATILIRFFYLYYDYKSLNRDEFYYSDAKVINIYPSKKVFLLKLSANNLTIYLHTPKPLRIDSWIRVKYKIPKKLSFFKYLKGFFVYGRVLEVYKNFNSRELLIKTIYAQHKSKDIANIYSAIFLAYPLNRDIREKIANLGLSHLIAISGFHLGILWSLVYLVLLLPYRFFQQRYFAYRSSIIDVGFVALIILLFYIIYIGAPPSVLRAYSMVLVGWIVAIFGFNIISFEFLIFSSLLLLTIFPKLILSYGFLLSFSGVFYIFLLLKYFKHKKLILNLITIPFGVFVLMFPISHYFFGNFSIYQLFSPIISVLFIPFYPVAILLHLFGFGYIFDSAIETLLNLNLNANSFYTPILLLLIYIALSIKAISSKKYLYATLIFAILLLIFAILLNLLGY